MVETAAYVVAYGASGRMTFINATASSEKEGIIRGSLRKIANGQTASQVFIRRPSLFEQLPQSAWAYWVSEKTLAAFREHPTIEPDFARVCVGVQTNDDFRFVRVWWEVASNSLGSSNENSSSGCGWAPFLKGGDSTPFFSDILSVINWLNEGDELKAFITIGENGGHWSRKICNPEYFFREGLSWALRTNYFSPHVVPRGCIPSVSRYLAVANGISPLSLVTYLNSPVYDFFVKLTMEKWLQPKFIVSSVKRLPFSSLLARKSSEQIDVAAFRLLRQLTAIAQDSEVSRYAVPWRLMSLPTLASVAESRRAAAEAVLKQRAAIVDDATAQLFESFHISDEDLYKPEVADLSLPEDCDVEARDDIVDAGRVASGSVSYVLGFVFGRWDVRYGTGEQPALELPDPFAPLPVCPPGMLQGQDGLPLSPEAGRQLRADGRYPLDVAWDGMLVDDPEHPLDVERRVHDVLTVLWGDRVDAIQQEACALLGVPTLREWFRRPAGFFADHLKRYSKSRRKAPIYWPISTISSSYTVWLYYHRFSKDTFFKVREIVVEKKGYEQRKLQRLKEQYGTQPTRSQAKETETQEKIANEIKAMCEEIDRIAPLWNPNLNDGVIINFAPLWRLVPQHKAWQKECKECWDELVAGNYDWAHLAMHLWPERVVPKCVEDASLAIAHGLEETFWQRDDRDRLQPRPKPAGGWQPVIDELVQQRSSPAVKAALKSLLEAPVAGAGAKKGRGRRGATS
jgi:hypothetical protein